MHGSTTDLPASQDRQFRAVSSASAAMLEEIAAFDERSHWMADGATSMTAWLAARYGVARSTAREWVRVAHALRHLPGTRRAFATGHLSFDQLKPLTRFVDRDEDEAWSVKARSMSPAQLWSEARRRERRSREEAADDAKLRYLWMGWDEEQTFLHLEGMLPAEQGAALEQALEHRAEEVTVEAGVRDPGGARFADALVGLVSSGGNGRASECLVIHADAALLTTLPEDQRPRLAETETGIRLAEETVRRQACDAIIEMVLEADRKPIGIGRRSRSVPAWLLRLLRHRDRGCRFPGCEHRRWLKAHHIHHWGRGGPTDLDNLVLLCQAHHRLAHEGGWSIRGRPADMLRFHDPGGRARPTTPPPERTDLAA